MAFIPIAFLFSTVIHAAVPSVPTYDLSIALAPEAHQIRVEGTAVLPPLTRKGDSIDLLLSDVMTDVKIELVTPRRVATIDRSDGPAIGDWRSNIWHVHPSKPIPAGTPIRLRFSYRGGGPQARFVFYIGPELSFAAGVSTAWYPELRVEDAGDEEQQEEELIARAAGVLRFKVPRGDRVIASGQPKSTFDEEQRGEFRFVSEQPVSFSFASGRFTKFQSSTAGSTAIYLLRGRMNVEQYVRGVEAAVAVLEREFGRNPYNTFALVEVPDEIAGNAGFNGASQEGFILTSSSTLDAPFNPDHYGHEISHQWWGNLVRRRGDRGRYLIDEAMAQYGALLVVRELSGQGQAARARFRGDPSSPTEQGIPAYLAMAAAGLDHPLSNLPTEWISSNIARTKGAVVLQMLADEVGETLFRRALHRIANDFAFRRITWQQFRAQITAVCPRDIGWFFDQWFDGLGAPQWDLHWEQIGDDLHGAVRQSPSSFRATADVVVTLDNGERRVQRVPIAADHTEFVTAVGPHHVVKVELDPEWKIAHSSPQVAGEAAALAPYWKGLSQWQAGHAIEAANTLQKAIEEREVPDTHAAEFLFNEALARVTQGNKQLSTEEKRKRMEAALRRSIAAPVRRNDRLPWVYYFLATILKQRSASEDLREAVNGAISAEAALGEATGWAAAARALLESPIRP